MMVWKIVKSGLVPLVLLSILLSCTRDQNIYSDSNSSTSDGAGVINLNISTKSVSEFLGDNGQNLKMYLFNWPQTSDAIDIFRQEVELTYVGIDSSDPTENTGYFSTEAVPYGNYYMVLVAEYYDNEFTADDNITTLSAPVHTSPNMTLSSVMYTMPSSATKAMQFFYGIEELAINDDTVEDDVVTATVGMKRNQAKVSIRIKDTYNLMSHDANNSVTVRLSGVPSTLDWEGKLVSKSDNSGLITIDDAVANIDDLPTQTTEADATTGSHWSLEGDTYVSEEVVYIVPAHRNDDDDMPSYTMTIEVTTNDSQNVEYSRTVVLDPNTYANANPPANQQVLYSLIPSPEGVTVEASLLDWDVEATQEEEINEPAALDCIVIEPNTPIEVSITDVYKEWNLSGGAFYTLSYPMDTDVEVVAEIISDDDECIKEFEVINRFEHLTPLDWTRSVLYVQSSGNEGSAVIGIRLSSDETALPSDVNGGYRWKWHVLVSNSVDTCDDGTHATNSSNANRSSDY